MRFLSCCGRKCGMKRISKDQYYLGIAKQVAVRSTCIRRHFGCVIVQKDQIISTGYCGAPRGTANCIDVGKCLRAELQAKKGEHYEWCRGVHAEQNAIIHASRLDIIDASLYLVGYDAKSLEICDDIEPCRLCKRMIINAGIAKVILMKPNGEIARTEVASWIKNNIGELTEIEGKLIPTLKNGY